MRWPCSCLMVAVLLGGAALTRLPGGAPAAPPSSAGKSELRGAGSCAAAACHNGNGAPGEKGSEYTTWVLHDPHSHAFDVLYGERSMRIEKNRQRPPGVSEDHPESDPLCLNCHVMPGIEPLSAGGEKPPRRKLFGADDGVSCEACHGAAGGWLTRHYTDEWRGMSPKEKSDAGMTNTKDLRVRAELCVRCHVGAGDLDVNHDLIAAGHPRLAFEYAAFHANLPKHWDVRTDKKEHPDFEARLWALGQALSAKAALELLAHRADAKNKRPWPEFAEYDCFACHHGLRDQKWRREPGRPAGRLGSPAWGTWYFPMLPEALDGLAPKELAGELGALGTEMRKPSPDRERVTAQAGELAGRLVPLPEKLGQRKYGEPELTGRLKQVTSDERIASGSWDGAVQTYLALAAAYSAEDDAAPARRDPRIKARIRALGRLLELPPAPPRGAQYDSPQQFSPEEVREALQAIRQALPR